MQDYYQILEVGPAASKIDLRESYRKLAFQYHPDRNRENPEASEKMKQLNEAYAVLSDPAKRRQYDLLRNQFGTGAHERFRRSYSDQDIFRGTDIRNVFEEMARAYGIRGFEAVFREFYGRDTAQFGHRRPGGSPGAFVFKMPFARAGGNRQPLIAGAAARLVRHLFERMGHLQIPQDGADISDTIRLAPQIAATGGPYAYYHRVHSKKLIVKIPAAVRNDQRIRLHGLGHAGKFGGKSGDLLLKVRIHKPLLRRLKERLVRK